MPVSDEKIYKYHVENIHSLEIALKQSSLSARKAISENNEKAIRSYVSLNSFLLGAWIENRLKKLLYEKHGFSSSDRTIVLSQANQLSQWEKVIELSFRKHFNVPSAVLNNQNLPFSVAAQYDELMAIINSDLRTIIENRNKLAHGQWIYPFNSNGSDIDTDRFIAFKNENIMNLQLKKKIITSIIDILHDLVVSVSTFQRDFDLHYKLMKNNLNNLNNRSYEKYKTSLIEKRARGIQRRNSQ